MERLRSVSGLLTRNISIIILLFSALALWEPSLFQWATGYTSWFLGCAMFGMGLTIRARDFQVVLSRPKEILLGAAAQYTVMPASAWLLCQLLGLEPDLALGVILVGCCPGGTASNVIAYIAGADVALSVGMTIASTLLAPLVTPLLVYLLAGAWVEVSLWAMILSVVEIVLVPVLLGITINWLFAKGVERVQPVLPLVSVAAIVTIVAGIVASSREEVLTSGLLVLGVVALHNLLGLLCGLGLSRLLRLPRNKAAAIAIEVGMQNSGLAVSLASAHFAASPLATLPGAVFSVWHNISGSIFASLFRRTEERRTSGEGKEIC